MPPYYGVQLLVAQHVAFQTPCSGAAAGPFLAKTVRSRGVLPPERKLA